jgi:repressor of nif and glnA expression
MTKTENAILKILKKHQHEIIGAKQILQEAIPYGIDLTERTIRYHMKIMDERGLTAVFGKRGRKITEKGLAELDNSNASDRVGFIISKIESLSFLSDFDCESKQGKVIINVSLLPLADLPAAKKLLLMVLKSPYVMSNRIILACEGESIGNTIIPEGMIGIGTLCSVTINAILLKHDIPIASRYGGLMEVSPDGPTRFTSLISYDGCSLDPLLVFVKGGMTSVIKAINDKDGRVLASYREIPVACTEEAQRIQKKLQEIEIGGLLLIGKPNHSLLEIPVGIDKTGLVVVGGLNPIAVLYEHGIRTESFAMSELVEYDRLLSFKEAFKAVA